MTLTAAAWLATTYARRFAMPVDTVSDTSSRKPSARM
jgi:hypothetical protein